MMLKVKTGALLGDIDELKTEIYDYIDVLKGDAPSPLDDSLLDMMEVSTAYYVRLKEIEVMILDAESDGDNTLKAFRTGFLRSAIELFKAVKDLGSRRVTAAKDLMEDMLGS